MEPFEKKVWLSSPTMHGDEIKWKEVAYKNNDDIKERVAKIVSTYRIDKGEDKETINK